MPFRTRFARAKRGESGSNFGQSPKFESHLLLFASEASKKSFLSCTKKKLFKTVCNLHLTNHAKHFFKKLG